MGSLGLCRRQVVIVAMASLVVVVLHVGCNVPFTLRIMGVPHCRHPLRLVTPKKSLHWAVVPAIPFATHALLYLITPQLLPKALATVVTALVRMKQQTLWLTP